MSDTKKGTLWVVATPLGNPGDLSSRAREVLSGVSLVLCEDTRRAARLFKECALPRGRLVSLYDHNEESRIPQALEHMAKGEDAALVSDAGTPLVSDPGYLLARAAREAGFCVKPIPGPSAVMAALCASGLPVQPFAFLGFLPRKSGDICQALGRFAKAGCTVVFFERKDRLAKSLAMAREVLGERECVIAREMTKTHEEFIAGRLSELAEREFELLGEITVVIGPELEKPETSEELVARVIAEELALGGKPKEMARRVAARLTGVAVKDIYERITAARNTD